MIVQEATLRYYFPQIEEKRYKAGTLGGVSPSSPRAAGNGVLVRRQGGPVPRVLPVLNHTVISQALRSLMYFSRKLGVFCDVLFQN